MKILFFSTYYHPYISGITTSPRLFLKHLAKNNQVTVLTFPHSPNLPKEEIDSSVKIKRMSFFIRVSKGFIAPFSFFPFLKDVRAADYILLNSPNFEGLLLAILSKLYRKKTYTLLNCIVAINGNLFERISKLFLNLSVHLQLMLSDKIITYTKDYFINLPFASFYKKKTVFTLPLLSIDTHDKAFKESLEKTKEEARWVGYAGRIASEKGLEFAIHALVKLREIFPGKTEFILAGPTAQDVVGENAYAKKILTQLKESGIPYRLLGKLTSQQLSSFFGAIDVLVLPSISRTEAFGIVQAQAMLEGTPVVSSNLPGVRVPVSLTGMGVNIDPRDTDAFANALCQVLSKKKKYADEAYLKKAREAFGMNLALAAYEKIFS